jgi:Fur family ferric uptake transcriptional regulator
MATGQVIEFVDPEIEALQDKIAKRLGYRLVGHRLSLFGERIAPQNTAKVQKSGDPD